MGVEIERKFLVKPDFELPQGVQHERIRFEVRQAYLSESPLVRVRIVGVVGNRGALITIKGPGLLSRKEYEYAIPVSDAEELFRLAPFHLEKTRQEVKVGAHKWEVDLFQGSLKGHVIAEVELKTEDEKFERPSWLGKEVTEDPRYTNIALAKHGWPQ